MTKTTRTARLSTGLVAGLMIALAFAAAPAAASAPAGAQIVDARGDVAPFSAYQYIGEHLTDDEGNNEAALAQAAMFDLWYVHVPFESQTDFAIEYEVAWIPNQFTELPVSQPGQPVNPVYIDVGGARDRAEEETDADLSGVPDAFSWESKLLQDHVALRAHFEIKGVAYVAELRLAAVAMDDGASVPRVDSSLIMQWMINQAVEQLENNRPLSEPNDIVNDQIDEAVEALAELHDELSDIPGDGWLGPNEECTREDGTSDESANPLVCSDDWAFHGAARELENARSIYNNEDLNPLAGTSVGATIDSAIATVDEVQSLWTIRAGWGEDLVIPEGEGDVPDPDTSTDDAVFLFHECILYAENADTENKVSNPVAADLGCSVQGSSDPQRPALPTMEEDDDYERSYARISIPKSAVGSPSKGEVLTKFRAESMMRGLVLDHAPDAGLPSSQDAPDPEEFDPLDPGQILGLTETEVDGLANLVYGYGADYVFRYAPPAPPRNDPNNPNNPTPSTDLVLSVVGESEAMIDAGGRVTYLLRLTNGAGHGIDGALSIVGSCTGWQADLSDDAFDLARDASTTVTFTVTAAEGASGSCTHKVRASIDGGAAFEQAFATSLGDAGSGGSGGGADGSDQDGGKKKRGIPGFEVVGLLAALGAVVVVSTRRRRGA